ncbi:MAG: hypothetical protein WC544_02415 [Patescibacteria group bacterium]
MADPKAILLEEYHFPLINQYGHPVVGWKPTTKGFGGLCNPRGYAMPRVVIVDAKGQPLYDQPLIVENAGSIVIAQFGEKVALIQNYRMVGNRILPNAGPAYIKRLQDDGLWDKLVASLGRWCWEAPRGLAPLEQGDEELERFIIRTAKLEAAEEAGIKIDDARIVGMANLNSTFFPHAQYVVHAIITSVGEKNTEDLELIQGMQLFTLKQLRDLNQAGEFDDGATLAALALCGLHLGGSDEQPD